MTIHPGHDLAQGTCLPIIDRRELSAIMAQWSSKAGADFFLVVQSLPRASARIISSNWIFDAVEDVGAAALGVLAASPRLTIPGQACRMFRPLEAAETIGRSAATSLVRHGHEWMSGHRFACGRGRYAVLLSGRDKQEPSPAALSAAQMVAIYALSQLEPNEASLDESPQLSERECECLRWVSHGKTTDEIALILGLSAFTVNGHLAAAMQKVSASNRAMAVATAIRLKLI